MRTLTTCSLASVDWTSVFAAVVASIAPASFVLVVSSVGLSSGPSWLFCLVSFSLQLRLLFLLPNIKNILT